MAKENMSKLERLIQQYCPDGVEYVKLDSVANICRGTRVVKSQLSDKGYPVYQNCLTPMGYFERSNCNAGITFVICGGAAGNVGYTDVECWAADDCEFIIGGHQVINRYIYYYLMTKQNYLLSKVRKASIPRLSPSIIKDLEIPLPPLPVQEEIVRILDAFTELQAELQAELQKRLQQYEYYKWNIFEGLSCPTKHITDVALVKARVGWQRLTTAEYQETGDYYLITGTDFKNGKIDFNSCVFVSKERYEMDPNIIVGKGDILITKDGTLGKVAFMAEEPNKPTTLNSGVFRIHTTDLQVSSRYLFHYFTSKYFTDFVNSVKTGSTIPHLTQQGLVSLNIPIPSLEEQNRVVSILDRFDTLTTDLTQGLPAEIEKRRQQYEYYRDKLLTFRRKGA